MFAYNLSWQVEGGKLHAVVLVGYNNTGQFTGSTKWYVAADETGDELLVVKQ
jgi:hypothetical protein